MRKYLIALSVLMTLPALASVHSSNREIIESGIVKSTDINISTLNQKDKSYYVKVKDKKVLVDCTKEAINFFTFSQSGKLTLDKKLHKVELISPKRVSAATESPCDKNKDISV